MGNFRGWGDIGSVASGHGYELPELALASMSSSQSNRIFGFRMHLLGRNLIPVSSCARQRPMLQQSHALRWFLITCLRPVRLLLHDPTGTTNPNSLVERDICSLCSGHAPLKRWYLSFFQATSGGAWLQRAMNLLMQCARNAARHAGRELRPHPIFAASAPVSKHADFRRYSRDK